MDPYSQARARRSTYDEADERAEHYFFPNNAAPSSNAFFNIADDLGSALPTFANQPCSNNHNRYSDRSRVETFPEHQARSWYDQERQTHPTSPRHYNVRTYTKYTKYSPLNDHDLRDTDDEWEKYARPSAGSGVDSWTTYSRSSAYESNTSIPRSGVRLTPDMPRFDTPHIRVAAPRDDGGYNSRHNVPRSSIPDSFDNGGYPTHRERYEPPPFFSEGSFSSSSRHRWAPRESTYSDTGRFRPSHPKMPSHGDDRPSSRRNGSFSREWFEYHTPRFERSTQGWFNDSEPECKCSDDTQSGHFNREWCNESRSFNSGNGYHTRTQTPPRASNMGTKGTPPIDLYKVLGVSRTATFEQLKKAHREMSMKNHPDRVPLADKDAATQRMAKINQAFDVLKDKKKRSEYDLYGEF